MFLDNNWKKLYSCFRMLEVVLNSTLRLFWCINKKLLCTFLHVDASESIRARSWGTLLINFATHLSLTEQDRESFHLIRDHVRLLLAHAVEFFFFIISIMALSLWFLLFLFCFCALPHTFCTSAIISWNIIEQAFRYKGHVRSVWFLTQRKINILKF